MQKSKLETIEGIIIVLSVLAPFTIMSLPKTIINETKSSSLINIVYITIICLLLVIAIYKLFKKFPGSDIIDISNFLGGPLFKNIVGIIFVLYFIVTSAILLRNFCESLKVVYYQFTNVIYILLLFIVAIATTNHLGFTSTIRTTTLIFPLIIISIILLFVGNLDNFSFERVFPILGNGFQSTFITGLVNIGCFAGISYVYFLPPLLKEPKNLKKIAIISVLFSGIFIFVCIATLLFLFSIFINIDEIMPLFVVSRYIEFGTFFQRFESLFLLIWTISFCCYLSIACKFSTHIFTKIFNIKDPSQLVYIFTILIFAISLIPKNYAVSILFESSIYRYLAIAVIVLGLFVLILSNLKKKVGG